MLHESISTGLLASFLFFSSFLLLHPTTPHHQQPILLSCFFVMHHDLSVSLSPSFSLSLFPALARRVADREARMLPHGHVVSAAFSTGMLPQPHASPETVCMLLTQQKMLLCIFRTKKCAIFTVSSSQWQSVRESGDCVQ